MTVEPGRRGAHPPGGAIPLTLSSEDGGCAEAERRSVVNRHDRCPGSLAWWSWSYRWLFGVVARGRE
jgi:hypothetical protein